MKKILTVLTIAALVASSVFAGFSGEASLGYTHDLDSKNSGFANGTKFKVDLDFATASAEKQAEGDIYAKISASLALKLYNGNGGTTDTGVLGLPVFSVADIKASINGANWSLDLLEVPGRLDLAKSAIDSSEVYKEDDDYGFDKANYDDPTTYAVGFKKAPGFGFTYAGYTVGLGFQYKDKDGNSTTELFKRKIDGQDTTFVTKNYYKGTDFTAVVKTPEIEVLDGLKIQGGASYFLNETAGAKWITSATVKGPDKKELLVTDRGSAVGGSVAVGFEKDKFAIKVATDLGYTIEAYQVGFIPSADAKTAIATMVKDKAASEKFSMDVAGNVKYDFISADGYMKIDGAAWDDGKRAATLVSGQVVTDLNTFDVPVKLTVSAKDILKTVNLGAKAEFAVIDGLTLTAKAGYVINTKDAYNKDGQPDDVFMGQWSVGLDAEYAFDYATVKAGVSAKNVGYAALDACSDFSEDFTELADKDAVNKVLLGLSASVETDSIIPGATLSLSWDDASDLLGIYNLTPTNETGHGHTNLGSITAKCKVTF